MPLEIGKIMNATDVTFNGFKAHGGKFIAYAGYGRSHRDALEFSAPLPVRGGRAGQGAGGGVGEDSGVLSTVLGAGRRSLRWRPGS